MTGEDTGRGKYSRYSAGLVCIDVYRREGWVITGFMGTEKKKVKELHHHKIEYVSNSRGYVGVSPPVLVVNIFREWIGDTIADELETEIKWKSIRIRPWLGETAGRAKYYLFHWGNRE